MLWPAESNGNPCGTFWEQFAFPFVQRLAKGRDFSWRPSWQPVPGNRGGGASGRSIKARLSSVPDTIANATAHTSWSRAPPAGRFCAPAACKLSLMASMSSDTAAPGLATKKLPARGWRNDSSSTGGVPTENSKLCQGPLPSLIMLKQGPIHVHRERSCNAVTSGAACCARVHHICALSVKTRWGNTARHMPRQVGIRQAVPIVTVTAQMRSCSGFMCH